MNNNGLRTYEYAFRKAYGELEVWATLIRREAKFQLLRGKPSQRSARREIEIELEAFEIASSVVAKAFPLDHWKAFADFTVAMNLWQVWYRHYVKFKTTDRGAGWLDEEPQMPALNIDNIVKSWEVSDEQRN